MIYSFLFFFNFLLNKFEILKKKLNRRIPKLATKSFQFGLQISANPKHGVINIIRENSKDQTAKLQGPKCKTPKPREVGLASSINRPLQPSLATFRGLELFFLPSFAAETLTLGQPEISASPSPRSVIRLKSSVLNLGKKPLSLPS